jgi:7-carboxy-7-deazaguanine synthase
VAYTVKEIFYTMQGEGANTGRPAVFLRFSGCNLWTGHERDRARAVCQFCDTDFVGVGADGGRFATAAELGAAVEAEWPVATPSDRFVVCTGGEPLLQLDAPLIAELHARRFLVAVETNGTIVPPAGIDWTCVSPKADAELALRTGDELKLVYPQERGEPDRYEGLEFRHFFLQPMDGPQRVAYTQAAMAYCLAHPRWRLSLQTHKLLGIR